MAIERQRVSIQEFDQLLAEKPDRLLELIDGEIVEKMPTERHGELAGIVFSIIYAYLKAHRIGRVSVESRYRPTNSELHDMLPDVAFRLTEGTAQEHGAVEGVPDIAIEIKSPDDKITQMRRKAAIYLENGSRYVWLIYPESEILEVYGQETDIQLLKPGDSLTADGVLPGFSVDVAEIFAE